MTKPGKNIFFENLDALRGIAFSMVFLCHFFGYMNYQATGKIENLIINRFMREGHLGVNLFFVLSGFLITYLLLAEKQRLGKINLRFFYLRRLLRIWPLYFVVLLVSFFLFPICTQQFSADILRSHLPWYVFFVNNFDRIATGFAGIGNDSAGILWSIAVEEQFYLFWPLIILGLNKKYYLPTFFLIILCSLVFRSFYINDDNRLFFSTFSVMSDLSVGASLAYCCIYRNRLFEKIIHCPRGFIIMIYGLLIILVMFLQDWSQLNSFTLAGSRLILSLFFAFVIAEQCYSKNSFYKLGRLKFAGRIGIVSYGLYCLHMYAIVITQKLNMWLSVFSLKSLQFYTELVFTYALCLTMAYLSYHLLEKRILKLKEKFVPLNQDLS